MTTLSDILSGALWVADTPGSLTRGALAGKPGQRKTGREMLEAWNLLSPNRPGADLGDAAGLAADLVVDPLNWLGGWGIKKGLQALSKGRKASAAATGLESALAPAEMAAVEAAMKPTAGLGGALGEAVDPLKAMPPSQGLGQSLLPPEAVAPAAVAAAPTQAAMPGLGTALGEAAMPPAVAPAAAATSLAKAIAPEATEMASPLAAASEMVRPASVPAPPKFPPPTHVDGKPVKFIHTPGEGRDRLHVEVRHKGKKAGELAISEDSSIDTGSKNIFKDILTPDDKVYRLQAIGLGSPVYKTGDDLRKAGIGRELWRRAFANTEDGWLGNSQLGYTQEIGDPAVESLKKLAEGGRIELHWYGGERGANTGGNFIARLTDKGRRWVHGELPNEMQKSSVGVSLVQPDYIKGSSKTFRDIDSVDDLIDRVAKDPMETPFYPTQATIRGVKYELHKDAWDEMYEKWINQDSKTSSLWRKGGSRVDEAARRRMVKEEVLPFLRKNLVPVEKAGAEVAKPAMAVARPPIDVRLEDLLKGPGTAPAGSMVPKTATAAAKLQPWQTEVIERAKATTASTELTLPDLFKSVKVKNPDLTIDEFKAGMVEMHDAGQLRLRDYTGKWANVMDDPLAIKHPREYNEKGGYGLKWYVRGGEGSGTPAIKASAAPSTAAKSVYEMGPYKTERTAKKFANLAEGLVAVKRTDGWYATPSTAVSSAGQIVSKDLPKNIEDVARSISTSPTSLVFQNRPDKVLISELYKSGNFDMTFDEFKRELVRLHREDKITLGRVDLMSGVDDSTRLRILESSTNNNKGSTGDFHVLVLGKAKNT